MSAKARTRWDLRVVACNSVGAPAYPLWQFDATEEEAALVLSRIARLPRPAALAFSPSYLWLRDGDCLVLTPTTADT